MFKTTKTKKLADLQALYEELEVKYGPALAQDIIDEIRKTEDQEHIPDFMSVKALSELTEDYRSEAQSSLKQFKDCRTRVGNFEEDIASLDEKRLSNDFTRKWKHYRLVQYSFYTQYRKAMRVSECPTVHRYPAIQSAPLAKQAA